MPGDSTKLSSSTTVAHYRALEAEGNREALGRFIVERFNERYFEPIQRSPSKHGFAVLAIACLVIETIESFYQGRADTKRVSCKMFQDFFARDTVLKVFSGGNSWFYYDIRCGILHQSEARGGWRVLRKGPLLDKKEKAINATALMRELRQVVALYAAEIETDEEVWNNFKRKMSAVCENCK